MPGGYRSNFLERDYSGFVSAQIDEIGALPVKSAKGYGIFKATSEDDILVRCGKPSASYPSVFEALAFVKKAPLWIVPVVGENALWGGIDVKQDSVVAFGTGRVNPANFLFSGVNRAGSYIGGTGDGIEAQFSGSIPDIPLDEGTFKVKLGSDYLDVSDSGGVISGTDIDGGGTNTLNYTTGAFDFTLAGTPGVKEETDIACEADVSGSLNNKYWWIFTKTTSYYVWYNVSAGGSDPSPSAPSGAPSITVGIEVAITTDDTADSVASATQSEIDAETDFSATVSTNVVTATREAGEDVRNAEDGDTGWSSAWTVTTPGADPSGAIPMYGQDVVLEYVYNEDISTLVSHSFFAASPYDDDLAVEIEYLTGTQFAFTLYQKVKSVYQPIAEYDGITYSLTRETDNFGKSIYIFDVFEDDPYVIPLVNEDYTWVAPSITPSVVDFTGGDRGDDPEQSHYTAAWDYFKQKRKYPAKIFMDAIGNCQVEVNNIVTNYQVYGHALSAIPLGNDVDDAVTFRTGLSIDSDKTSLYTNWSKIEDAYNNSYAWISNIGSIGGKYAMMSDIYDSGSPAGVDENGHGGQLSDWKYVDVEYDYVDPADLKTLDQNQINPVIKDDIYGVMAYGDKTLQVSLSDTSFIGARRLYNYIIERIVTGVLRLQDFRNNDEMHRLRAQSKTESFLEVVNAGSEGALSEYRVVCNEKNNNAAILNQRKFILDIYVIITPNTQEAQLRLTRLPQGAVIADFIQS